MRRTALILVVSLLVGASCGGSDGGADDSVGGAGSDSPSDSSTDPPTDPPPDSPTGELMAAALRQVATVDNTFGGGPPPFDRYLVQADTDPTAGADGVGSTVEPGSERPLTEAERAAVEEALESLGPVEFIDDPDAWRTDDLLPTVEGSVILGVGEPTIDDGTALVPVSLWCGGLCGTWLTYRLELVDGTWTVAGIEGPVAIS